ncbi:lipid II:glycine glycyltransferase FemX [Methanohalophilus levihalophilus]|uniref:lipid II:glycine glycyltransferase FemX n=1 Tax=Methanohalophilus levihalophilus TaxID=1431282 RepID=UPI001AE6DE35|nr:peptidoglycan bridge formation glycyltransferase FemA/FemB family protein [Methanohalophilus levihalophilus]
MITVTDSLDADVWDAFVLQHTHGTIFQTSSMAEVYRKSNNYRPVSLAAVDESSGDVLALLQASIICEINDFLGCFTGRSIIMAGPLVAESEDGQQALDMLLREYDKRSKNKTVFSQVRNLWDTSDIKNSLGSAGYAYEEHLDYLIDLNRDADAIWSDISKSRRKGVNRAEKSGITIRRVQNAEELAASYEIIKKTYLDVKVPVADISLFRAVYDEFVPKGMADFFIALKDDMPVGARITLNYKELVYDWYAGSKKDVQYVDEALVWHILKTNAGVYKVFDFGGAGHPDKPYGVREFKRRFGGEQVNFGRYEKVNGPLRKRLSEIGYGVYKKLK